MPDSEYSVIKRYPLENYNNYRAVEVQSRSGTSVNGCTLRVKMSRKPFYITANDPITWMIEIKNNNNGGIYLDHVP